MVPSKAALTPRPAVALVTPLGNKTSGQIFRHLDPQAAPAVFKVYSVVRLTRMVPSVRLLAVEMTRLFGFVLDDAPAVPTRTREEDTRPTTRAAAEERREIRIRGREVRLV
jgi:hypothetical protein